MAASSRSETDQAKRPVGSDEQTARRRSRPLLHYELPQPRRGHQHLRSQEQLQPVSIETAKRVMARRKVEMSREDSFSGLHDFSNHWLEIWSLAYCIKNGTGGGASNPPFFRLEALYY